MAAQDVSQKLSEKWKVKDPFEIPTTYSTKTEEAISSGLLLKKNRTEIIQALSTSMLVYRLPASSIQYHVMCFD